VLILLSIFYSFYLKDHLPPVKRFYRDSSGVLHSVPYSPIQFPPFGTDRGANNLFWKVIEGAKYTIGTVLIVSAFQLIFSTILGAILSYSFKPIRKTFDKFAQIFYYIPTVLIIWFIIPVLNYKLGVEHKFLVMIAWQLIILIGVAVSSLSLYVANEIDLIMKKEFIVSANVLGGSKFFVFRKHVWPNVKGKVFLLFFQQCSQTMILLTQLGILYVFIGGGRVARDPIMGTNSVYSFSNEWAGLMGANRIELFIAPWIVLAPLLMFAISIFMMNMIYKQIEELIEEPKLTVKVEQKEKKNIERMDKSLFEMAEQG
jgi:peptide/nickel transport system permease protein